MLVVMVSGRAGSGKSTFSNYCIDYLKSLGHRATLVPFAKGVKRTAKDCFGWDGKKDRKGRKLLQDIGLVGRAYNENLWADQAIKTIDQIWVTGNTIAFIDDWRFTNEGKVISDRFNVVKIRVIRPDKYLTLFGTDLFNDISEISLSDDEESTYDFKVNNDDDLEKLSNLAEEVIDMILKKEEKNV